MIPYKPQCVTEYLIDTVELVSVLKSFRKPQNKSTLNIVDYG